MTSVAGRIAIVTGGGSGIGRGIAATLAERGARVAVADIEFDRAQAVAAAIGGEAFAVDVSDRTSVDRLASDVAERMGPVGVLVNNAGVGSVGRVSDMTRADWEWMVGVNFFGVTHGVSAFLPQLRETRGHIAITGSAAGLAPEPGIGGYSTTKFAVTAYAEILATELRAEDIGVTLLAPGPVATDLGASSRNRPSGSTGALRDADLAADGGSGLRWMDPRDVGEAAVDAIEDDVFYVVTHPEGEQAVVARHRSIEKAFRRP